MEIQVGSTVAKKARRPRTTRKGDGFLAGRSDAALRITKLLVVGAGSMGSFSLWLWLVSLSNYCGK
jgi:hypothetical protein